MQEGILIGSKKTKSIKQLLLEVTDQIQTELDNSQCYVLGKNEPLITNPSLTAMEYISKQNIECFH
jgi:hypothetical protein